MLSIEIEMGSYSIWTLSIGKGPELSILARSFSKAKWQETNKHKVYRDMEQNKGKGNDTLEKRWEDYCKTTIETGRTTVGLIHH